MLQKFFTLSLFASITAFSASAQCPAYKGEQNAPVKINIYNPDGICFKLVSNGAAINEQSTANATVYMDYGKKKLKFITDSGEVYEDEIGVQDIWASAVYEFEKGKKDKWKLRRRDSEYNEKGLAMQAERRAAVDADMAKMKEKQAASDAEWDAKTQANRERQKKEMEDWKNRDKFQSDDKDKDAGKSSDAGKTANNTNTNTNNNASTDASKPNTNSGSNNNTASNSGSNNNSSSNTSSSSSMRNNAGDPCKNVGTLKVMYNSVPVKQTLITLKHGENYTISQGTTDANGVIPVCFDNLMQAKFDIYGERGSTNWNMSGLYYFTEEELKTLDTSIELSSGVKTVAEMMGVSSSMLARGWGFE